MLKKKHKVGEWYHTWCLYEISKLSDQNCRRRCILQLLYIITLFQNFKKSPKIQKWSDRQKKHKPGERYHAWCLYEISKLSD